MTFADIYFNKVVHKHVLNTFMNCPNVFKVHLACIDFQIFFLFHDLCFTDNYGVPLGPLAISSLAFLFKNKNARILYLELFVKIENALRDYQNIKTLGPLKIPRPEEFKRCLLLGGWLSHGQLLIPYLQFSYHSTLLIFSTKTS